MFKKNAMKNLLAVLSVCYIVGFSSCSEEESGEARLKVVLVDAPASYDEVNVDVQSINVRFGQADDSADDDSGWTDISDFEPQVFNLLDLTNGSEEVLADVSVANGTLGEVRLVLGDENSLVMDGVETALTVPSGGSSGLKIKLNAELKAGITYTLVLDFDAANSVTSTGSGNFNLRPVIHAKMDALTGAISGNIVPADLDAVIYATQGDLSFSTYPDEAGQFLIQALDAGTYDVYVVSGDPEITVTAEPVTVTVGEVEDAGTFSFE